MTFAMPIAADPVARPSPFATLEHNGSAAPRLQHPPEPLQPSPPQPHEDAQPSSSSESGRYVAGNGHLAESAIPDGDRHGALAIHLSPLAFIWIGPFALAIPLIIWLVRKDDSSFVDDHGRECVNFIISFILMHFLLAITFVGILLIPVLWVIALVGMIRGAVAANRNEYFRYPVTIRFL